MPPFTVGSLAMIIHLTLRCEHAHSQAHGGHKAIHRNAVTTHPSTTPMPVTRPAQGTTSGSFSYPAMTDSSRNAVLRAGRRATGVQQGQCRERSHTPPHPASSSASMRSRTVSLPRALCRATAFSGPPVNPAYTPRQRRHDNGRQGHGAAPPFLISCTMASYSVTSLLMYDMFACHVVITPRVASVEPKAANTTHPPCAPCSHRRLCLLPH